MLRALVTLLVVLAALAASVVAGAAVLFALALVLGGREEVIGILYLIVAPAALIAVIALSLARLTARPRRAMRFVALTLIALLLLAGGALWLTSDEPSRFAPRDSDPLLVLMIVLAPAAVVLVQWLILGLRTRP